MKKRLRNKARDNRKMKAKKGRQNGKKQQRLKVGEDEPEGMKDSGGDGWGGGGCVRQRNPDVTTAARLM
jgi:hypothetical protein